MPFPLSSRTLGSSGGDRKGGGPCKSHALLRVPQHSELEVGTPELRPSSLSALGSCVVRGNAIDFELVSKFRFQTDIE